jgi:DNA-binding winged helix-turn-helix (wHTH) protein
MVRPIIFAYCILSVRFRFGPFTLDTGTRELLRGNAPVHLSRKAFELLTMLVENRPWALGKDDLHARIWPGTFVSDTSLSTLVNEIRTALDDSARQPKFVRTVHAYGYAFCGHAEALTAGRDLAAVTCWVRWQGHDIPLADGVNVLGREFGSTVRIDLREISRRHASIVVAGSRATIEDLGSRNGTFVGDDPVRAPTPLHDGDAIRLGTVALTFHIASHGGTTEALPARRAQI